jgi:outer membrane immunogenic protein
VKYTAQTQQVAAYNWTGFYLGINGGYANSNEKTTITGGNPLSGTILATGFLPSVLDTGHDGWTFGGQIGWNFQYGGFVWGIETDLQFSDTKASASQLVTLAPLGVPIGISGEATAEREWFGTVRGRAGILLNEKLLVYGTGGLAYGSFNHSASASLIAPAPFGATAAASRSETEWGWTVGAGMEAAFAHNWRLKAEYLYSDYGDASLTYGTTVLGAPVAFTATTPLKYHDFRVGLNYNF